MSEQDANAKAIRLERVDLDFRSKPKVIEKLLGEGELTKDQLDTFGNRAVAKVPNLQKVLRHVCEEGFEHHVVMTQSHSAELLAEAFGNYFGWEAQHHQTDCKG